MLVRTWQHWLAQHSTAVLAVLVLGLAVYRALSLLVSMASIVTDEEVFAQVIGGV